MEIWTTPFNKYGLFSNGEGLGFCLLPRKWGLRARAHEYQAGSAPVKISFAVGNLTVSSLFSQQAPPQDGIDSNIIVYRQAIRMRSFSFLRMELHGIHGMAFCSYNATH